MMTSSEPLLLAEERALSEPLLPTRGWRPRCCGGLRGLLFTWVSPTLGGGLSLADALSLPGGLAEADAALQGQLAAAPDESLTWALSKVFWPHMRRAALCKLAADLLRYLPPLVLSRLLGCVHSASCAPTHAYLLALALPAVMLGQALLVNQYFWHALRLGAVVRGSLTSALCRRMLRYHRCDTVDSGRLANMISSDCGRLNTLCGSLNMAWSAPLQLVLALVLLALSLGPSVLAGICVMLLLWPVQVYLSHALAKQRALTAKATDERLQRTEAALGASKAVKFECWEPLCVAQVQAARATERTALRRQGAARTITLALTPRPSPSPFTLALHPRPSPFALALRPHPRPSPSPSPLAPRPSPLTLTLTLTSQARGIAKGVQRAARDAGADAGFALDVRGAHALRR